MTRPIEPRAVVDLIEQYVDKTLSDAAKYENSRPLDEPGIYSLHVVAAQIYALGFADGEQVEAQRGISKHLRVRATS